MLSVNKYWAGLNEYKTNSIKKLDFVIEEFISSMNTVINRLRVCNNLLISDLSGGYDSRMVLLFLILNKIEAKYMVTNLTQADVNLATEISDNLKLNLTTIFLENFKFDCLPFSKDFLFF